MQPPRPTYHGTPGSRPIVFYELCTWEGELTDEHLEALDAVARIGPDRAVFQLLLSWHRGPLQFKWTMASTKHGSINGPLHPSFEHSHPAEWEGCAKNAAGPIRTGYDAAVYGDHPDGTENGYTLTARRDAAPGEDPSALREAADDTVHRLGGNPFNWREA